MPVVAAKANPVLNGSAKAVLRKDVRVLSIAVCTQVHFIQARIPIMNAQAQEVADTLPLDGFPPEIVANIQIITKAEAWLQTIEQEYSNVPDVATKDGMATAREWRRSLVAARTQGNAARLAAGRPLTEMKKKIDDTWKKYEPRIKALEDPLDAAIKAVEEAAEREKEKNRQAEAARVKRIEDLIDDIRAAPIRAVTLEDIKDQILMLRDVDMASFDEYIDAGRIHVDSAMKALNDRLNLLIEQAEETKRLEASKIAQEARQKELDAQAAKQAAELKAQQDAMAEQQRKLDEQAAEMGRRQREQEEREAADVRRKKQEEHDRIAAEQKAIADKEAAELAAKLAEEQRIQAEKDAAEQAKRDEEAAEAEAGRIAAMAPDIEKLRLYLTALDEVKQPEVKSDEANYLLARARSALGLLMSDLIRMEQSL